LQTPNSIKFLDLNAPSDLGTDLKDISAGPLPGFESSRAPCFKPKVFFWSKGRGSPTTTHLAELLIATMQSILDSLIKLSHEIGREQRRLAILGEGNTSADLGDGTFLVKASGCSLSNLDASGLTRVRMETALAALDDAALNDAGVRSVLEASRVDPASKLPSVETFMHAICLSEGGAKWVGHCHAESVLSILASVHGAAPFLKHIFPDAIVVCGRHLAVVPYIDPGLELARNVRASLRQHIATHGSSPKVILLENHGPVALGASDTEVLNILLMLDKWARILCTTLAIGGPRFLPETVSDRIDNRPDEHYRRAQIAKTN
jgi:ribulose-5-phosphate 4-epimerase/fuculose-1-phosphate aldolase